ncbi:MAG TPA: hypothetical protein VFA04_20255 [Bryobacteraceae bacterium]|nr:hypothetical protein [Bryobacteraceae bacterium]
MNTAVTSNVVPIQPNPDAVRKQLERTLSSAEFAQADRMSRFLRFIVTETLAGRTEMLKETVIGVHVFDREPGYDPKADPVVRSQARRLRQKLFEYTENHPEDPIWIDLPKGGYVPEFRVAQPRPQSNIQTLPIRPLPPRSWIRRNALSAAACAVALIAVGASALSWRRAPRYSALHVRPFTAYPGYQRGPAFSPDGRTIAFSWDGADEGAAQIYIQEVDGDTPRRVTNSGVNDERPVWSPDGKRLAFLRRIDPRRNAIYTLDLASGNEQKHAEVLSPLTTWGRVDWSPDGRLFVTSDRASPGEPSRITLISVGTGKKRFITSPPASISGDTDPVFSPDGKLVAFRRTVMDSTDDLYVVTVSDQHREPKRITFDNQAIEGHAWVPDGQSIVAASRRLGGTHNLWEFPVSGGSPTLLTQADESVAQPAASHHGGWLAWGTQIFDANIWALPLDGAGAARRVIASTMLDTSPQLSPDGRNIAFRSDRTGANEIWVAKADGTRARQLTHYNGPLTGSPRWSPDGKLLAFETRDGANADIVISSPDGGPVRRFTSEPSSDILPSWSRDGKSIYFASDRTGQFQVWKQPVVAGPARQITKNGGFAAFESPDGRYVYYSKQSPIGGIYRVPAEGGPEETLLADVPGEMWGNWAVSTKGVYFLEYRRKTHPYHAAIMFYDFATTARREIANTTAVPVAWDSGVCLSPDERTLFFTQVDRHGENIYIAEAFR